MLLYKLKLSDDSFYIVDENFVLKLRKSFLKKALTIKQYLSTNKYRDYYLIDIIDGQKIIRAFKILAPNETEQKFPTGIRLKYAIDISKNDLVLGVNGGPERVTELHNGLERMYDITVNGETYTVNEGHILELVEKETGEHLQMQVGVYIHMDDEFKSHYAMEVVDI